MLNYLWAGMTLIGILWAAFHGNLNAVTDGALTAAKEAVALCITMLGVVSFWTGILEIGQRAGIIERISARMRPLLTFLFPGIPGKHPAMEAIAANMIANVLGLGWAATPAGLKAMEELSKLEKERGTPGFLKDSENSERRASNEMCTFLILNISSLQLNPGQYDRLPESVWQCESDSYRRPCSSGYLSEYDCGGSLLPVER